MWRVGTLHLVTPGKFLSGGKSLMEKSLRKGGKVIMPKYVKKRVAVEAVQFKPGEQSGGIRELEELGCIVEVV